jgi:hypothetical protein
MSYDFTAIKEEILMGKMFTIRMFSVISYTYFAILQDTIILFYKGKVIPITGLCGPEGG